MEFNDFFFSLLIVTNEGEEHNRIPSEQKKCFGFLFGQLTNKLITISFGGWPEATRVSFEIAMIETFVGFVFFFFHLIDDKSGAICHGLRQLQQLLLMSTRIMVLCLLLLNKSESGIVQRQ